MHFNLNDPTAHLQYRHRPSGGHGTHFGTHMNGSDFTTLTSHSHVNKP